MHLASRTKDDGTRLFFILTFAFTWLLWVPAALTGQTNKELPTALLWLLGGFGPSIAGIVVTLRYAGAGERRDFWRSVVDFRRIRPGWYALILLIFPVTFALAIALGSLLGAQAPGLELSRQIIQQPTMLIGVVISCLIGGPLSEELGWRGCALERLVGRRGVVSASLILALAWGVWHLPLFFIEGTNQFGWGFGSPSFWLFLANLLPLTILMSCAYLQNHRSTLSAVLVHFMWALTLSLLVPLSIPVQTIQTVIFYVAACGLFMRMLGSPAQVRALN